MIKKLLNNSFKVADNLLSLKQIMRLADIPYVLPFYHTVSNEYLPHLAHLYPIISVEKFNRDIDFFLKNYKPITPCELVKLAENKKTSETNYFYLSFDDGLREFYDIVAPILIKKGVHATCFVNTGFLDNKNMFYRMKVSLIIERIKQKHLTNSELKIIQDLFIKEEITYSDENSLKKITSENQHVLDKIAYLLNVDFDNYLLKKKPYLTTFEIEELIKKGFSIGAHSVSHPNYEKINETEQINETLNSIRFLKAKFNIQESFFSFPFTDFNVKKSFFKQIETEIELTFGTANMKLDEITTNLQRIPMERENNETAESIIRSEYLLFILKKILRKHIIYRS